MLSVDDVRGGAVGEAGDRDQPGYGYANKKVFTREPTREFQRQMGYARDKEKW